MRSEIQKLLFIIAGLLVSLNVSAQYLKVDGISYYINSDGKSVSVGQSSGYTYSGDIVIPEKVTYNGTTYSVTVIGAYAFYGCGYLKSVTIPNSVTSIESEAFYGCTCLTSVTIPNFVTSIGTGAFRDCAGLTSVTIGESVTSIGWSAFLGCTSLTSVTIGNSVTSIGGRAFEDCTGLTSVTIPNSVTSIGESAFIGCTGLTGITIPNSVTSIEGYVFNGCSGLTSIVVEKGNTKYDSRDNCNAIIETATNTLTHGCKTTVIPNSVTSIGDSAFRNCTGLTSITIPDSVTSIGGSAFANCTGLTRITIPDSVTSIGRSAFLRCTSLTSVVVEKGNPKYDSRDNCNAIIETATNTLTYGCKTTVIPNSVTSIGKEAFLYCSGLTSVTIPNSVISIGIDAFRDCAGLTSVTIGDSVTSIGWSAFLRCTSLTSVTIGNSVTSIEGRAFEDCTGLTSVTIPNSVITIGLQAFRFCKALTSITIPNSVTSIGTQAFNGCTGLNCVNILTSTPPTLEANAFKGNEYIYVPIGSKTKYINSGWSGYNINEGLRFGELLYDFKAADSSFSVYRPVFMAIKNCQIPSTVDGYTVTSIMDNAFNGCTGLTSITIPNSVTSLGASAFSGCKRLSSITIPSSVTSMGENAFLNCNLRSITIDDLNWWFRADNTLSLQGPGMIYLNGVLIKHLVIPDGISTVRALAFANCLSITGITISNSVTEINDQAFMGCSDLQNVIVGESVLNIGMQVFKGCPNIKEITCLGSLPATIFADTFQNYDATLFVPGGSLNIYKYADHWINFTKITEGVSGVEGVESDGIKVVVKGGAIEVSGADGERVEVYSLSGQCIYSGMETSISVEKGIYIVRVAGEAHKVIL